MAPSNIDDQHKPDADNNEVPEWQKQEVLLRLKDLDDNLESAVDWETAMARIKQMSK
jgi:Putative addiction module component